jgi:ribosome-binding factor A
LKKQPTRCKEEIPVAVSKRQNQMAKDIKNVVATLLIEGKVADPRVKNTYITHVQVSPDMSVARVYFGFSARLENAPLSAAEIAKAVEGLKSASKFLRSHVGNLLKTRVVPELSFFYDDTLEKAQRVNELLSKIKQDEGPEASVSNFSGSESSGSKPSDSNQ